jgi:hypothetical protein
MCFAGEASASAMADPAHIAAHSQFFDRLVELVPAKYYLEREADRIDMRSLKKGERRDAKATFKQQAKQAKRARLDPEQAASTLAQQAQQAQQQQQQARGGAHEREGGDRSVDEKPGAGAAPGQLSFPSTGGVGRVGRGGEGRGGANEGIGGGAAYVLHPCKGEVLHIPFAHADIPLNRVPEDTSGVDAYLTRAATHAHSLYPSHLSTPTTPLQASHPHARSSRRGSSSAWVPCAPSATPLKRPSSPSWRPGSGARRRWPRGAGQQPPSCRWRPSRPCPPGSRAAAAEQHRQQRQ